MAKVKSNNPQAVISLNCLKVKQPKAGGPKVQERRSSGSKAMYQFGWDGKTSKPTKEDFTVTAQTLWDDIAHGVLSGVTLRVFAHLALGAKFSNRLEITQVAVAQAMGISPQQVSVAFRQLKEKGYIIRITDPGGLKFWYLDARRTFRGSAERHAREQERQSKQRTKDRVSKVHQLQA